MTEDQTFAALKYRHVASTNININEVCLAAGTIYWVNDSGQLHREGGPAVTYPDGSQEWRIGGKLHRVDGPAVIWANSSQEWWIGGKRHRTDGPAIIFPDGTQEWWIRGRFHRVG